MHSHSIDLTTGLLLAIAIASLWIVSIIINRFFFHPLSNFPGPKLAITTYAHEWYYDLYSTGLTFKLKELHEQYGNYATPVKKDSAEGVGPVIRINPTDLHCDDPDYFDDIFNVTNGKADKPYRSANSFGPYPAAIGTADHDLHRLRRSSLNPFFSKRSVTELVPTIKPIINRLCTRLREASKTGEPVDLKYCFAAVKLDVMNEYCFSKDSETLLQSDFGKRGFDDVDSFLEMSIRLMKLTYALPEWFVRRINPAARDIFDFREGLSKQVEDIRNEKDLSYIASGYRTIFHDLLQSKLPAGEMGRDRLRDEAFSLVTAGSGTTASVMKALSYHVAANPRIQKNLLQELKSVMPHPGSALDLKKPEGLPYFTAVIQEGLRLAIPVSHRLSRIFQQKTLVYQGKVIPPRTAISMTPLLIHQNEDIFPDAEVFRPERWLSDKKLQRYLVAFSRGPRSCLGINLALAELYLVIAKVFRQFNFDVSQVVRERDIDVARDVILGVPRPDSKGVVVKVLISED